MSDHVQFRLDKSTYRALLQEAADHGVSPGVYARHLITTRYDGSGAPDGRGMLVDTYSKAVIARIHHQLGEINGRIRELVGGAIDEALRDDNPEYSGSPGQGAPPPGTPRKQRRRRR